MPITLAAMEGEVVNRIGGKMALAGMSVATDGTNSAIHPAIRDGLAYVGLAPADPIAVTDADVAAVPVRHFKAYRDSCTLEALYIVQGVIQDAFDQQIEEDRQALHQIAADIAAMIANYEARVPRLNLPSFGVGCPPATRRVPPAPLCVPRVRYGWF